MSTPNKYEGHTPGDWQVALHVGLPVVLDARGDKLFDVICTDGLERVRIDETYRRELMANARLIADAPALLAENERLREALADLVKSLREYMPAIAKPTPTASGLKAHYMLAEAALAPATPTAETK